MVYQHIATFKEIEDARKWLMSMYPGQILPDSWLALYKEQGSAAASLDYFNGFASVFAYKTDDPYFELIGKFRAKTPEGMQIDILKGKEYKTDMVWYAVTKYRGFATRIGENRFKIY